MHEVVGIMTGAVLHDLEHPDKGNGGGAPREQASPPGP
jgi:hypothetical protein